MIDRDPNGIPSMYKAATSFTNRNGDVIEIGAYGTADEYGLTEAQRRHLDPNDSFSVYEDMDVDITVFRNGMEMTQTIKVPAPAKQWRYWHRRMMEQG